MQSLVGKVATSACALELRRVGHGLPRKSWRSGATLPPQFERPGASQNYRRHRCAWPAPATPRIATYQSLVRLRNPTDPSALVR